MDKAQRTQLGILLAAVTAAELITCGHMRRSRQTDTLTGLAMREAFCRRTASLLRHSRGRCFVLIRCDIDRFKTVNETRGSAAGDALLQTLAQALRRLQRGDKAIRELGRCGDDHFLLCCEDSGRDMPLLCRRIQQELCAMTGSEQTILSFGLCRLDDAKLTPTAYCDRALAALRSVKSSYREKYAWYDAALRRTAAQETSLSAAMGAALAKGEFVPYYQPQYHYPSGEMIGAEALVRWVRPDGEFKSPAEFLPYFEKTGFLYEMDKQIWRQVCAHLRKWLDAGLPVTPVSINVARGDLRHAGLEGYLLGLLHRYELPPKLLHLEITEDACIDRPEELAQRIRQLQEAGFCVEMDDFGSGYSSLHALKTSPVELIKLDMQFLSAGEEEKGRRIVAAIAAMMQDLGLPLLAEGVETAEQAAFLHSVGCERMQGYFFARPMPAEDYEALLREQKKPMAEACVSI